MKTIRTAKHGVNDAFAAMNGEAREFTSHADAHAPSLDEGRRTRPNRASHGGKIKW